MFFSVFCFVSIFVSWPEKSGSFNVSFFLFVADTDSIYVTLRSISCGIVFFAFLVCQFVAAWNLIYLFPCDSARVITRALISIPTNSVFEEVGDCFGPSTIRDTTYCCCFEILPQSMARKCSISRIRVGWSSNLAFGRFAACKASLPFREKPSRSRT